MPIKSPDFWLIQDSLCSRLLRPVSWIYNFIGKMRSLHAKTYESKLPVICIGNVVMGGVGKTPLAISIAEYFKMNGKKPCFLTRGYGGTIKSGVVDITKHTVVDTGDEPQLLAQTAPVVISGDRIKGAKLAEDLGVDVIIMDDGFQNPYLKKDLSFVVFDGKMGIGNGCIFPAGPLRESVESGLKRADACIVVGQDQSGIKDYLASNYPEMSVIDVHIEQSLTTLRQLDKQKIYAFAGIGMPMKFFSMLQEYGCNIVKTKSFSDHYFYTDMDIIRLINDAAKNDAILVTTAKDIVRIDSRYWNRIRVVEAYCVWDNPEDLCRKLGQFNQVIVRNNG